MDSIEEYLRQGEPNKAENVYTIKKMNVVRYFFSSAEALEATDMHPSRTSGYVFRSLRF